LLKQIQDNAESNTIKDKIQQNGNLVENENKNKNTELNKNN